MKFNNIPLGLKDGKLITIQEIPENIWGLDCECLCPSCYKPLVVVRREGKRYFRHKMNEIHCHFDYDKFTLDYIWELLEEIGIVEDMNLDLNDLQYFKFLPGIVKEKREQSLEISDIDYLQIENNDKIKNYIHHVNKENNSLKMTIHGEEYTIKLGFKKESMDNNLNCIFINIKELISDKNTLFTMEKKEIINAINNNIAQSMSEKEEKRILEDKKQLEKKKVLEYLNAHNLKHEKEDREVEEKKVIYENIVRMLPKKCPKCGANLCIRKARVGTVITCSRYPECNMTAETLISMKS